MATTRTDADRPGGDYGGVAIVLVAAGFALGFLMFCVAVLYDAIVSKESGLSSNATQILTAWGGGMIGIIGGYVGYRSGRAAQKALTDAGEPPTPSPPGNGSERSQVLQTPGPTGATARP